MKTDIIKMDIADSTLDDLTHSLQELQTDSSIPKNVKLRIDGIITILNSTNELTIRVNKALNDFDDIVSDINLQPHTRTQIWNIVSLLESCSKE